MQQHPIPQNVTQYQFRLVGDMTLKQFLELALGLVLAYLFYSSNLIFIIKWPLAILSLMLGAGLAFFPIEDRPLDQWITNFIKAIYSPTRFIWKKSDKIPAIFTFEAHPIAPTNTITKTIKAPIIANKNDDTSDLTQEEWAHLTSLDSLFSQLRPPNAQAPLQTESNLGGPTPAQHPTISIRKLRAPNATTPVPVKPTVKIAAPTTQPTIVAANQQSEVVPQTLIFSSSAKTPPTTNHPLPTTNSQPLKSIRLPVSPKFPNLVVGVITDTSGKLIEGAIVQILDASGLPARAIKTNTLGQFATSTPLAPGNYTIEIEADGHIFTPQQLIINNSIIPPFEIRASS